jgi:hypothetical protein
MSSSPRPLSALVIIFLLQAAISPCGAASVDPPPNYSRSVHRTIQGAGAFALINDGRLAFSIWIADPRDVIMQTAAADFRRYFLQRWGFEPALLKRFDQSQENVIVFASNTSQLPAPLSTIHLSPSRTTQSYLVQRVSTESGRVVLLCLGGSPIASRYASIEVIRRMTYTSRDASFIGDRVEDEPYNDWRALYINDSNHQFNNYNPNLICDVSTYRWSLEEWKQYVDQIAFQRYNVLQIWLVPQMFSPDALAGNGEFAYFRDTMRAVARYAETRGISLALLAGINASVKAGTLLNTLPVYQNEPIYRYLSPNNPKERALMFQLWDYWSRALPEVKIWSFFPGDPGGCHEEGCGPETYVDLAIELSKIIKRNNPSATIDFTVWQFFGWGTSWISQMRRDSARIDRGFQYLLSKIDAFPPDTIYGININEFTSEPGVRGTGENWRDRGGYGGGSATKYIEQIGRHHLVHTWSYSVTEGEGWINHHYRVPDIIQTRDVEARYPIAGGICYTMTPALNFLNQFACAEAFWNPTVSVTEVMDRYTEGVFGTSVQQLTEIFPSFNVAPTVGYTFDNNPNWKVDYPRILADMERNRAVLDKLAPAEHPRFVMLMSPREYISELVYFSQLYIDNCKLGLAVERARALIHEQSAFRDRQIRSLRYTDAQKALETMDLTQRRELEGLLREISRADVPGMKTNFTSKHYQIFLDCKNEFTELLPLLVNGFFDAFGADFVSSETK